MYEIVRVRDGNHESFCLMRRMLDPEDVWVVVAWCKNLADARVRRERVESGRELVG